MTMLDNGYDLVKAPYCLIDVLDVYSEVWYLDSQWSENQHVTGESSIQ